MALVSLYGDIEINPACLSQGNSLTASTAITTLNTTKIHLVGRFWNKDRATKNITKIYVKLGTVAINSSSVLQMSIQAISASAGPPGRGDGTVIKFGTIAGSSLSSAATVSVTLDAAYSAALGSEFAVVLQLTTFTAADSVVISSVSGLSSLESFLTFESATPTFTVSNTLPIVIFEHDDGTFGTFYKTFPVHIVNSLAVNSGSAADEIALEFSLPFNCTLSGCRTPINVASTSDFDIILYSGTTVLATGTPTLDATKTNLTGSARVYNIQFPATDLTANTTYAISILPTTANSISINYHEVSAAGHWQCHAGDINWGYKTRVNAGSWSSLNTTRRPAISLLISAVDSGSGGSGGVSRTRAQGGM